MAASKAAKAATPTVECGSNVTYVDHKGHEKHAIVTGTPASVVEGTSLPTLKDGELHIHVVSPSGRHYNRKNVSHESLVVQPDNTEAKAAWDAAEAERVATEQARTDSRTADLTERWIARSAEREYSEEQTAAYLERKLANIQPRPAREFAPKVEAFWK